MTDNKQTLAMDNVYLVMMVEDYERSYPVKAFESELDAAGFVIQCDKHKLKKPRLPYDYDNQRIYDAYDKHYIAWRKKHPAGADYSGGDDFVVMRMPVIAALPAHAAAAKEETN